MAHDELIREYANHPKHIGFLDCAKSDVGTGLAQSTDCCCLVRLQIRVAASGRIDTVRFRAFGCGATIAVSALAAERLDGATLEEALALSSERLAEELHLPATHLSCARLAEEAVRKAVDNYWQNHVAAIAEAGLAFRLRAPSSPESQAAS